MNLFKIVTANSHMHFPRAHQTRLVSFVLFVLTSVHSFTLAFDL